MLAACSREEEEIAREAGFHARVAHWVVVRSCNEREKNTKSTENYSNEKTFQVHKLSL